MTVDDIYPWINVLLIACFIGVYEYLPQAMLAWSVPAKLKFYDSVIREYGVAVFVCVKICFAVGLASASALLVVYWRPCAAGSGIPPTIEFSYDGRLKDPRTFDWQTVLVKTIGIALIITAGVPVGREGPAIHIGAGVAFIVSGFVTQFQNCVMKENKVNSTDVKRKMVLFGSAAGFASAFRSPMGGILYVIEEIAADWDVEGHKRTGCQMVLCAALSAYVTSVIIRASSGGGDIDFSSIVITQEGETIGSGEIYFDTDIIGFLATAVVCGISGGFHTMLSLWFHRKRKHFKGGWRVVDTAVTAAVVAIVFSLIPLMYRRCENDDAYDSARRLAGAGERNFVQYNCDSGEFSALASLSLSGEEGVIRHLMSRDKTEFSLAPLCIFYVFYLPLMAGCMGMAVPQGSFVPNLLLGALNGRIVGELMQLIFKNSTISSPGVFALIGAASQLGAWTRTMITVVVTMVEITGDVGLIVPMAICTIIARQIAETIIPINYTHAHVTIHHEDAETTDSEKSEVDTTDKNLKKGERYVVRKSTLQTLGILPESPSVGSKPQDV